MEDEREERRSCRRALCRNRVEPWQIICKECWEEYQEVRDQIAEREKAEMEWEAEREWRRRAEAGEQLTKGGKHEQK